MEPGGSLQTLFSFLRLCGLSEDGEAGLALQGHLHGAVSSQIQPVSNYPATRELLNFYLALVPTPAMSGGLLHLRYLPHQGCVCF